MESSGKRHASCGKMPRGIVFQALAVIATLVLLDLLILEPALDTRGPIGAFVAAVHAWRGGDGGVHKRKWQPFVSTAVKPGISLVAVCMGRSETLKKTAKSWLALKRIDEIIVVDWSSKVPLEPVIRGLDGGERIKVVRVEGEKRWVLSRAYNIAVNATSYASVFRVDCDYLVDPNFVRKHRALLDDLAYGKDGGFFYSGYYMLSRNENEVHLNGAVFVRRKDFLRVGGYDERIQTYGWDDEDLYKRLGDLGLAKYNISYDYVHHVAHADSSRAQEGVKFAAVEIDLNSLLLEKLPKWNSHMRHTVYSKAELVAANSVRVRAASTPKSLRQLCSVATYETAWATALGRRLHDSYGVPWGMVADLKNSAKEQLLRRLMRRLTRLESASKGTTWKVEPPKLFVCHCMHGLGNRMRALASCMSFANTSGRELVVVWERDAHTGALFSDLFDASPLVVMDKLTATWPLKALAELDAAWNKFKLYNYMQLEGHGAAKDAVIADDPAYHIYYKGAFIIKAAHRKLSNWEKNSANLRKLKPVSEVEHHLQSLQRRGLGAGNVIGLHIRNRTLATDIENVDFRSAYGDKDRRALELWRKASSVYTFIAQMHKLIAQKPKVKFFVATDTVAVIRQLERIFGKQRILSIKRSCDSRNATCLPYALADMYALSKCESLYGSNWSSFTECAMRLGGPKAMLAGVDFGVHHATQS